MEDIKIFNLRLPKDLWRFLKNKAFREEISLNEIVKDCLIKYKKRCEKDLTKDDTMV